MYLTLKEENGKVTGTAGPNADRQVEIINGKVSGDRVMFQVSDPSGPAAISFELTLASDRLYGDARAEYNGQKMEGKIALKRPCASTGKWVFLCVYFDAIECAPGHRSDDLPLCSAALCSTTRRNR